MDLWFWVWLAAAVFLVIAEIFTAGFFMLPFGIAAALASLLAFLGVGLAWQWATFLVVSAALLLPMRRFAEKMTHEPPQKVAGNRLIGRDGLVIDGIEGGQGAGRVRVDREEWVADSQDGRPIAAGQRIRVIQVVGVHLVVAPVTAPGAQTTEE